MSHTIIYIPLDERPCNLAYPVRLFAAAPDAVVLTPPAQLLGHKKHPADVAGLRAFVQAHLAEADALVYATEMLVYGGLLPSRIYDVANAGPDVAGYEAFVTGLKASKPSLLVYASNLIMRTPRYSSGDEEPAYYEDYGADIFRHGWLQDKAQRDGLDAAEIAELAQLKKAVPAAVIADYEGRRAANLTINLANIGLVKAGALDYLAIPQDDSAPYGYTARDQSQVYPRIRRERLQHLIGTYPGADEAGYTLLARATLALTGQTLSVYPLYASAIGKLQVPLYEDRPQFVTIESHILAAGATLAATPAEADLILAVNTAGKQMTEARTQLAEPELTYDTYRNLRAFVARIKALLGAGKPVALADAGYANGGDLELMGMLDAQHLLPQLVAYRGWNTDANTVGSTLGTAIILQATPQALRFKEILTSLYDDGFYQAIVRGVTTDEWLPSQGLNYFDLKDQAAAVAAQVEPALLAAGQTYLRESLKAVAGMTLHVSFPWNRMFEINLSFTHLEVS